MDFHHVKARQTRLLPSGYQQNQMGSAGAVPRPSAGGDRRVRDGLVSDKSVDGCVDGWCVCVGQNKELDRTDGATHAAEQKRSGRAARNTRCFTSLYDGDSRADTLAAAFLSLSAFSLEGQGPGG